MSFAKRFGIVAAMEELQEQEAAAGAAAPEATGDDTPSEEVDIPVAEDTVETAAAEVDMAESDVDAADETIADAESDLSTLDGIADKLEATEENGGIDAGSAAIVEVAVEHLYQKLGVIRAKAMPALESFGADSSRLKATRIAVEDIRENAKKIWDAILRMVEKAKEFITKFFKAIFTATGRIKERALKLKEAASKIQGEASSQTIENAGFAPALAVGSSVDYSKVNAFFSHGGFYKAELDKYADLVNNTEKLGKVADDFKNAVDYSFDPALITSIGFKPSTEFGEAAEGFTYYSLSDLPAVGGKTIAAYAVSKAVSGQEALKAVSQFKVEVKEVADTSEVNSAPTLKISEAQALLDYIIKICDTTAELNDVVKQIDSTSDLIIRSVKSARNKDMIETLKAADRDGAKSASEDVVTKYDVAKDLIKALRAQNAFMTKLISAPVRLNFSAARAATEYVGQSLKLYSAKAE